MTREKRLLQLLADDLHGLHSSAISIETNLHRLSNEMDAGNGRLLSEAIAKINRQGFGPIAGLLHGAGAIVANSCAYAPEVQRLFGEAAESSFAPRGRRLGTANAISILRRSARYMEMYCSSLADAAMRLRLPELAQHLRSWARHWIGFELTLNAVASGHREPVYLHEETAVAV